MLILTLLFEDGLARLKHINWLVHSYVYCVACLDQL